MKLKGGGKVGVWVPLGWPWPCQTAYCQPDPFHVRQRGEDGMLSQQISMLTS